MRDSRWCIVNLVGKHGRVRTVPMPTWSKNAIDAWTIEAGVTEGHLFRPINRGDQVLGDRLSEKVVWQVLKSYVVAAGLPDDVADFEIAYLGAVRRNREPIPPGTQLNEATLI
jgi:site-specific recombinase XerD